MPRRFRDFSCAHTEAIAYTPPFPLLKIYSSFRVFFFLLRTPLVKFQEFRFSLFPQLLASFFVVCVLLLFGTHAAEMEIFLSFFIGPTISPLLWGVFFAAKISRLFIEVLPDPRLRRAHSPRHLHISKPPPSLLACSGILLLIIAVRSAFFVDRFLCNQPSSLPPKVIVPAFLWTTALRSRLKEFKLSFEFSIFSLIRGGPHESS